MSTVILATPESASTSKFNDFMQAMLKRGDVDRVVVDKSHVILDARRPEGREPEFRPRLFELGDYPSMWGLQTILILSNGHTITRNQSKLLNRLGLKHHQPTVFRIRTTQHNIRYAVHPVRPTGSNSGREPSTPIYMPNLTRVLPCVCFLLGTFLTPSKKFVPSFPAFSCHPAEPLTGKVRLLGIKLVTVETVHNMSFHSTITHILNADQLWIIVAKKTLQNSPFPKRGAFSYEYLAYSISLNMNYIVTFIKIINAGYALVLSLRSYR
ncbi:hypothetical protein IF1G_08694 [Cordyceps javanica]|uniref:Uncharacterized protein n=1 Tax=Cordyceps javanica TaxID=43265 RepID=A0A545UTJ7_9HYPO|nr:hypothetical protein IF1G_08694 [Cordyceps javanica]TQW03271.1 nitrile hydratase, alpha chain domain-containing protein [Cordyceps javanica]